MEHIIAVLNQKGGVGKTTTAVNVATYLAKSGKQILLVDFDPQGNATSGLGLNKASLEHTTYDILFNQDNIDRVILDTGVQNLFVLPTNADLAAAEVDLVGREKREELLKKALEALQYDFIIIDCPPALGLLTVNALTAAHWLLIPVQAEYYALEGLGQLLAIMQRIRGGLNPQLELLGVVVTMYDGRTSLSQQVHQELVKHFGDKVFRTIIPRNIRLAEAPSFGKPIAEHDKWSKGARAYKQLTREIVKRVNG